MKILKVYKSFSAFLFYLTLIAIVAGINFSDSRSPGWFTQTLPVSDQFNDLFFIDTLRGWMVGNSYIIHSYNGGYNWIVQKNELQIFKHVQFLDTNYGYVVGGNTQANIQKTTNGGLNWIDLSSNFGNLADIGDLSFINKDTGWVCIYDFFDGGVYRTTNGGGSWSFQQFDQHAYDICFINKDTGWYSTNELNLYRTINGGVNWTLQYTDLSTGMGPIYFINGNKGWIQSGSNGIKYTTNGGFNWNNSSTLYYSGLNFSFINENTGYSGTYELNISKTTNGGIFWGYQNTPLVSFSFSSVIKNDSLKAWGGRLFHTTDGGGPIIINDVQSISSNVPDNYKLFQNYPNPFNPISNIKYKIEKTANIKIIVFDIKGKEIITLVNKKQSSGEYEVKFNARHGGSSTDLSSGIYFYSLFADGIRVDTKKAVLIK